MRIVNIEDFFHPNTGYQLNILSKFMVKQGHEVIIVTGELEKIPKELTDFFGKDNIAEHDKAFAEKTGVRIIRLPLRAYISGRGIFYNSLEKTIEKLKPDILFIHDSDTFVGIKYILKVHKLNYPLVYDNHMLEMASINPFHKQYRWFYRKFVTPKIKKYQLKIIRMVDDDYVEKCLGIPLSQCPYISVGSDTMLFHPDKNVKHKFRRELNVGEDDFIVVYAGKLIEGKGASLLANTFQRKFVNESNRNVILLVVGNTSGEYGKKIESIFNKSENRVVRFPTQKYFDLAKFFQVADIAVFPKECSLSFFDVQACGLPVVSEDNSVNVYRLKHDNGFTFKAGDQVDFRAKVTKFIEMAPSEYIQFSNNAYKYVIDNYDYEYMAKQYTNILIQEYNRFHQNFGRNS